MTVSILPLVWAVDVVADLGPRSDPSIVRRTTTVDVVIWNLDRGVANRAQIALS